MHCSVPVMFQLVSYVYELRAPSPFIVCTLVVYPCSPRCSRIVPFDGHFRIDLCSCLFVSGQWNDRPLSSHCSLDLVDLIPHLPFMSFLGQLPPLMYIYPQYLHIIHGPRGAVSPYIQFVLSMSLALVIPWALTVDLDPFHLPFRAGFSYLILSYLAMSLG